MCVLKYAFQQLDLEAVGERWCYYCSKKGGDDSQLNSMSG